MLNIHPPRPHLLLCAHNIVEMRAPTPSSFLHCFTLLLFQLPHHLPILCLPGCNRRHRVVQRRAADQEGSGRRVVANNTSEKRPPKQKRGRGSVLLHAQPSTRRTFGCAHSTQSALGWMEPWNTVVVDTGE